MLKQSFQDSIWSRQSFQDFVIFLLVKLTVTTTTSIQTGFQAIRTV
jgi:hypothetical protein